MHFYFAYGSNMWNDQMCRRCPDSRKLGHAVLRDYRWIITTNGYASIVVAPGEQVEGILWEMSATDETKLDGFEGVAQGRYTKEILAVHHGAATVDALVYIDSAQEEGPPRDEYIGRINAALHDAALSEAYVSKVIRRFIPERSSARTLLQSSPAG